MPLVDFSLQETWDSLYSAYLDDGTLVHFDRRVKDKILGNDHHALRSALNLLPGQAIVIIGGFGWIAEDWLSRGLGPIICIDNSPWIQANKAVHAALPILNEDALSTQSQANILTSLGTTPTWVITEDVLPCYADSEILSALPAFRAMGGTVVHWVSCAVSNCDVRLNWKTQEQWKALVGPDLVVRRGGAEVL